jgi:ribosome-binding ATPase
MKLAIIGKPQSGKTTIFNAAAGQHAAVGDFSKTVHRALVKVPDTRLDRLTQLANPKKTTHATIEILDAPGLSGQGKKGGALEISDELRMADAFLMVVDAFSPDARPEAEMHALVEEMILLDQVLIDSVIEKREHKIKMTGDKAGQKDLELLKRCLETLSQEKPLLDMQFTEEELKPLRGFKFLSLKPLLIVLNIAEKDLAGGNELLSRYAGLVSPGRRELVVVCGSVEAELVDLEDQDRRAFMDDLGISAPATELVIQRSYALLGLISFLTAGEPEVRAWTITKGTNAQHSAGVIHTDIERGFIRAEVVAFADYDRYETMPAIKAAGKHRLEGKEYIIQDGDVILFRFNV